MVNYVGDAANCRWCGHLIVYGILQGKESEWLIWYHLQTGGRNMRFCAQPKGHHHAEPQPRR